MQLRPLSTATVYKLAQVSHTQLPLSPTSIVSLSLHFNGHFQGGPTLAGTRMSSFWLLLELRMMEVVSGNNWSYKTCKAPVKMSPPTNQHPVFYRPDALPVSQPSSTVWYQQKLVGKQASTMQALTKCLWSCKLGWCLEGIWEPSDGPCGFRGLFTGGMPFLSPNHFNTVASFSVVVVIGELHDIAWFIISYLTSVLISVLSFNEVTLHLYY